MGGNGYCWEVIRVKGREKPVLWAARSTRHGPLISNVHNTDTPVALRWTALDDRDQTVETFYDVADSRNWKEFTEALSRYVVPAQNFVYADRKGNIGYISPGRIPIRNKGDGMVPVPGWDGSHDWSGWIPFKELPRAFNPAEGYLATANQRPVVPEYSYLIAKFWKPPYRAYRIKELLEEKIARGQKFSLEDNGAVSNGLDQRSGP